MTRIIIYKITNLINKKCYVGVTSRSIKYRWHMHNQRNSQCRLLSRALNKYKKENFCIEEIYVCFDYDHANNMEDYFIKFFNSLAPNGYNLREGGKYGKISEESKEEFRKAQHIRWANPEEKKRQSEEMKKQWDNGSRNHVLENLKIHRDNIKRKVVGINIKNKKIIRYSTIRDAEKYYDNVGSVVSNVLFTCNGYCWFYDDNQSKEQLLVQMAEVLKNKKSDWKNLPGKEDRVKKMREGNSYRFKKIIAVDINTFDVIMYENVHDAIRDGFSTSSIYGSLKQKTVKGQGYCWFYYNDQDDFQKLTKLRLSKLNKVL